MSAENYYQVLITRARHGRTGVECRVLYGQYNSMAPKCDFPPERPRINRKEAIGSAAHEPVFANIDAAKRCAEEMDCEYETEHGIQVDDLRRVFFPASDRKRRRRRFFRRS